MTDTRAAARPDHEPRLSRIGLGLAAVAAAVALARAGTAVRHVEALGVHWLLSPFTPTFAVGDSVVIGVRTAAPVQLRVTSECTSAVLVLPSLLAFGLFVAFRGVRLTRALLALVVAAGLLFAVNEGRIAIIAWAYLGWGGQGLWVAHVLVGTLISLAAVLAGLVVQLRLTARQDPQRAAGPGRSAPGAAR